MLNDHIYITVFCLCRALLDKMQSNIELADFSLTESIINAQDQIVWESMGLIADQQSMQNAALLTKVYIKTKS